ncbi:MAG: DUF2061 domain-containing protein [Alphaproteobacteria bacterium]|nr:DUF2061 domain-containing protein [Alphaproteobacteria bacterium]
MIRVLRLVSRRWLAPLTLGLMLLGPMPTLAQQAASPGTAANTLAPDSPAPDGLAPDGPAPDGPAPLPVWQRTLYKTITYQAVANASDLVLFDLLIGGGTVVTAGFFTANAVSAAALYYGFEYAWQTLGPPLDQTTERTLLEKTILYRAVNSGRNFALGYTFGGGAGIATAFVAANFITDTAIFVTNEYVWDILRPQQTP